ncbi:GAF domain-like protein, partial [Chytriomyces sp. MP71]
MQPKIFMSPSLPTGTLSVTDKSAFYKLVVAQVAAILDPDLTLTANLANVSSVLFYALTDAPVTRKINWCGFYLTAADPKDNTKKRLILGPFQGRVACTVIPFGRGVCGTAATSGETQLVPDVHQFKGHIACDSASESEIVVPIVVEGRGVVGVLDIDCLEKDGFDLEDVVGMEAVVREVVQAFA